MKITKEVTSDNFPLTYLTALNGELRLTGKELTVAAELCKSYMKYKGQQVPDSVIAKLVFGTDGKAELKKKLKMESQHLRNVLASLQAKGFLAVEGEIKHLHVPDYMLPGNLEFVFILKD